MGKILRQCPQWYIYRMKPSKSTFYRRFLDDERSVGIESDSGLKFSFFSFFFMIVFVGAAGIFPTFVGYNMDFLLSLVFFIYTMVMFGLGLILAIIHIHCAYKYRFYRKEWYLWLFLLPFFILAIGIDILAIFTGHSYINDEGYYSYAFNPAFFFLGYLPLFILWLVFASYGVLNGLGREINKRVRP